VIVGDLDVLGVDAGPDEADPPLIVDADRILPGSVASKGFEPMAGGTRRSSIARASAIMISLRRAARTSAGKRLPGERPSKIA
jgi:hypothetical protein